MTPNGALWVEILGRAGVGKSTVCRTTAKLLRDIIPDIPVQASGNSSQGLLRDLLWSLSRPSLLGLAWQLSHITRKKSLRFWLGRLRGRPPGRSPLGRHAVPIIHLQDMGLLHFLNKTPGALPDHLLDRLPLPDLVVVLTASACDVAWRRVQRGKPFPIRYERAVPLVREFLHERGEEDTLHFLAAWNRQSGEARLSEEELHRCFEIAGAMPPPDPVPSAKVYHFQAAVVARGVRWFEVDNPQSRPAEETAREVVDILMRQLAAKGGMVSSASSNGVVVSP